MKAKIIGTALAAACITVAASAHARNFVVPKPACVTLENAVYEAVLQASAGLPAIVTPAGRRGSAGLQTCWDTARAVTSGFTRAMAERNVYLRWQWPGVESGDLCLSADLSQCYPKRNPFVPFAKGDAAFVRGSWHGVLRAVGPLLPGAPAGDVSRFSRGELSTLLGKEIRRGHRGRAQQAYYLH